jgi:hypothetical protein
MFLVDTIAPPHVNPCGVNIPAIQGYLFGVVIRPFTILPLFTIFAFPQAANQV